MTSFVVTLSKIKLQTGYKLSELPLLFTLKSFNIQPKELDRMHLLDKITPYKTHFVDGNVITKAMLFGNYSLNILTWRLMAKFYTIMRIKAKDKWTLT